MCCLAKCLLGALFGWVIFAVNIAASGALLAGAFSYWSTYSGSVSGASLSIYVGGLGIFGTGTLSLGGVSTTVPSTPTLINDISALLMKASAADATVVWTTTNLNAVYLGMAGQVAAAAITLGYLLFNSLFCLCTMCCCCCPRSPFLNILLALAKLGAAFIGVVSMGTSMTALEAAFTAISKSSLVAPAIAAAVSAGTVTTNAYTLVAGIASLVASKTSAGVGSGKGLGSLGVALLGLNVVLHVLIWIRCGGAEHHPEEEKKKEVVATSSV